MIEDLKRNLNKFSLPSKPKSFGEEYHFPEDVEKVSSVELGNWMFKLAAWKGYALRLLATIETEKSWVKNIHDNKVSRKVATESTDTKKATKDFALGQLIQTDEEFRKIKERLIIKESELEGLKSVLEIYTMQIEVVSREISRRSLDLKITQAGIN